MAYGHGGARPGAGRKKGIPNKHKTAFREQLRDYCDALGVDPHRFMADLLANDEEIVCGVNAQGEPIRGPAVNTVLKFHAARELAQYLEPKLKAMDLEISGNAEKPLVLRIRRAHGDRE